MQIKVLASDDANDILTTRMYEFDSCQDAVFLASVNNVKSMLGRGMKINLDQTLLLFGFTVADAAMNTISKDKIRNTISKMLSHNNVMIGVPEMLQNIQFEIIHDGMKVIAISITSPIAIPEYNLRG